VRKVALDMATRIQITKEVSERYRRAQKKEKGKILDEFCKLTGYNRKYAGRTLRKHSKLKACKRRPGKKLKVRSGRGRKPIYTNDVRKALVKIWAILDCPCGKRLVAAIPDTLKALEKF